MKKKIIIVVSALVMIIITVAVLFSKNKANYDKYQDGKYGNENVNDIFDKIEDLENSDISVNIEDNIDDLYDYYICLYIRSALEDYIRDNNIDYKNISFKLDGDDLIVLEDYDHVMVNMVSSNGVHLSIKMDRTTDTWSYEVIE